MVKGAKALEMWCQRAAAGYPGVDVCNMSGSWRDGLAFCAIIHRYRPDLIDFTKLDKKNIRGNCALAFRVAEEKLGIPQLLDPEDMATCHIPDRLSILTYVSEYYHKFKTSQPKGSPLQLKATKSLPPQPLKRQDSTDSAGMPLSRTPSSSGVSSHASSSSSSTAASSGCDSSSSSVCDSPPPTAAAPEEEKAKKEEVKAADQGPSKAEAKAPGGESVVAAQADAKTRSDRDSAAAEQQKVVLRRRERSAASRRLVQSMFLESTGGISSLVNSSSESPSPEIEKENPFREAMIKFTSMDKKQQQEQQQQQGSQPQPAMRKKSSSVSVSVQSSTRKSSVSKATETASPPKQDSKSTQTLGVLRQRTSSAGPSPFKSVLQSQLSMPAAMTTSMTAGSAPNPRSLGSALKLSYTSSPRPYSGQMGRSSSMGQALNSSSSSSMNSPISMPASPAVQQVQAQVHHSATTGAAADRSRRRSSRDHSAPGHVRRPSSMQFSPMSLSMYGSSSSPSSQSAAPSTTPKSHPPQVQHNQRPLIWHSSPYSSTPSLYSTPNTTMSSSNNNSIYFTPPTSYKASPQHGPAQSKGPLPPQLQMHQIVTLRQTPLFYSSQDRLKLHIEGQSSLV